MSDANPSAAFHRNALQYLYLHELEQSALRANGLARGTGFEISPPDSFFAHNFCVAVCSGRAGGSGGRLAVVENSAVSAPAAFARGIKAGNVREGISPITVMRIRLSLQKNVGSEKNTFAAVSGLGG